MKRAVLGMALLAACGRVGFDPRSGGDDGPGDASSTSDGVTPDTVSDTPPDLCASAIAVNVGSTPPLDTCSGLNQIDTCSTGKRELVFKFVPPATAGYTIRARDAGTQNVSNPTVRLDASCAGRVGGCTGVLGTSFPANQPVYFAVEATGGACAMIEFEITAN